MQSKSEYLHFTPEIEVPDYNFLVNNSLILSPQVLVELLESAYKKLTKTPGKNLTLRQFYATSWLGWWIDYLSKLPRNNNETIFSVKMKPNLSVIKKEIEKGRKNNLSSGLLLMGGGEGTDAHRHAVDWVGRFVDIPILLIEHPEYVNNKERGGRFLPLSIGISMWAHHPNTKLISLVPQKRPQSDLSHFYQDTHNQTG